MSIGAAVVRYLREQGFDVISVSEALPQAIDQDILQYAVSDRRIVITNDKDFGDLVFRDGREHVGILLLRLADDRARTKIRIVASVIHEHIDKLADHFVVATERDIRIRPLK